MRKDRLKDKYSDATDASANFISKVSNVIHSGSIKIDLNKSPAIALSIEQHGKKIYLDLSEPDPLLKLRIHNNESISIFEKIKIAKEFAHKLREDGITLYVLRNGKEAITFGEEAKPTLSRIITRSDDIQIDSVIQSSKLDEEL